jgi:hypothetical protein
MSCTIPMSEITGTFAYIFDSLVLVRVSSTNEYGTSTTISNFGNARARRLPSTMSAPVIASSSDTSIVITWTELSGTTAGNSAIISYTIYWNKGTDASATTVVTEALFASPTYTFSALTGGNTYRFAIRGENVYGYGTKSAESSVAAIDVPAKMAIPTVALSSTTPFTDVVITWTAPNTHYSAITDYDVTFQKSDGSFTPYTAACPGTDESLLTCTVDMLGLNTLTGLTVDTLIRVKVRAQNAKGWGSYSEVNIAGQTVETIPAVMSAPTIDTASVTTTTIIV